MEQLESKLIIGIGMGSDGGDTSIPQCRNL